MRLSKVNWGWRLSKGVRHCSKSSTPKLVGLSRKDPFYVFWLYTIFGPSRRTSTFLYIYNTIIYFIYFQLMFFVFCFFLLCLLWSRSRASSPGGSLCCRKGPHSESHFLSKLQPVERRHSLPLRRRCLLHAVRMHSPGVECSRQVI